MRAVVVETDSRNYELDAGEVIEVLGFVYISPEIHAVWRDDAGYIWPIAASVIRMLPNTESTEQAGLERLRTYMHTKPQVTNAIAGPQTGRGVR
jgi:hypothetical protein